MGILAVPTLPGTPTVTMNQYKCADVCLRHAMGNSYVASSYRFTLNLVIIPSTSFKRQLVHNFFFGNHGGLAENITELSSQ